MQSCVLLRFLYAGLSLPGLIGCLPPSQIRRFLRDSEIQLDEYRFGLGVLRCFDGSKFFLFVVLGSFLLEDTPQSSRATGVLEILRVFQPIVAVHCSSSPVSNIIVANHARIDTVEKRLEIWPAGCNYAQGSSDHSSKYKRL